MPSNSQGEQESTGTPLKEFETLIQAEIEALKHFEMISERLVQALAKQMEEAEQLKEIMKRKRKVLQVHKDAYGQGTYVWSITREMSQQLLPETKNLRTWLEENHHRYAECLDELEFLREEIMQLPDK